MFSKPTTGNTLVRILNGNSCRDHNVLLKDKNKIIMIKSVIFLYTEHSFSNNKSRSVNIFRMCTPLR